MSNRWEIDFNINEITEDIKNAVETWQNTTGVAEVAEVQANTPVLTGNLRRSITFKKLNSGTKYTLRIGSALVYAAKVEYENKSYIRSTLNRDISNIKTSLLQAIRSGLNNND